MPKTKSQPKNWQKISLGDYLDFYNGKSIKPDAKGTYPVYGSNGKIGGSDKSLYENALIIGRVGAYCGSVQYEHGKFWASDNTIVAKTKESDLEHFAYYLLQNLNLNNYAGGAAQPLVTQVVLKQIMINIPASGVQKQIAGVLSAYDDLIENNAKRIKVLEEMAQVIYKEWFVYFRFPGNEKVKMVDSKTEFGKIPEGWGVKEVTKFKCFKFSKPKINKFKGVKKYYATADISVLGFVNDGEEVTFDSKPSRAQIQPNINSVWFARMKDTRKIVFFRNINSRFANTTLLSSGMAGFQSENDNFAFMFSLINSQSFHTQKDLNATGATQVSLTDDRLKQIKMVEPPINLIQKYSQTANPWLDEILFLQKKNEILRQARDLLLPKLINGEIRI